jgi:ribosomal protein S12 methylthiotransferase accessory factor
MKIEINLLEGQQLEASFGQHTIISDQSEAAGGLAQCPEPFDYFLASMPLCAAFYIRKFCQARDINTDGLKVIQHNHNIEGDDKYKKAFNIEIELPEDFPKKYRKAVIEAANTCTVKKVIQSIPEFNITVL